MCIYPASLSNAGLDHLEHVFLQSSAPHSLSEYKKLQQHLHVEAIVERNLTVHSLGREGLI